jgi:hypothetical protein
MTKISAFGMIGDGQSSAERVTRISWKTGCRRCLTVQLKDSILPHRGISDSVNKLMKYGEVQRMDFTLLCRSKNKAFTVTYYDSRSAQAAYQALQKIFFLKPSLRDVPLDRLKGDTLSIPVGLAQSLFKADLVTGILDIIYSHMTRFGDVSTVELHHTGQFADITFYDPRAILRIPSLENEASFFN